jgi:hypothetical protein
VVVDIYQSIHSIYGLIFAHLPILDSKIDSFVSRHIPVHTGSHKQITLSMSRNKPGIMDLSDDPPTLSTGIERVGGTASNVRSTLFDNIEAEEEGPDLSFLSDVGGKYYMPP